MSAQPSATASLTPNPTTPAISGDLEWITAYLTIHRLSTTSWRYAYLLWIVVGVISLTFTVFHWARLKGGVLGAYWSKWSLRRRTWRKKHSLAMARRRGEPHRQPIPLPSNAQILCLTALVIIAFALTFAGPDYLAPGNKLWQFGRHDISSRQSTDTDYSQLQPQYTISKAWWTSGGRAGLISMALFPLCILFILKAPPFALFAIPFFMNLHFDKMLWLHRWCGRLIWLIATLHTAFWSVQLVRDTRAGTGNTAYTYAWQYPNFIYAWTSYGALTLLIILSLRPLRERHYEAFYFLHVLFVPLTIVMAGLHHPPFWWWCWAALALWMGERIWRGTRWLYMNGFIASSPNANSNRSKQTWEMHAFNQDDVENSPAKGNVMPRSPLAQNKDQSSPSLYLSPRTPYHAATPSVSSEHFLLPPNISDSSYIPPTGYAHADLVAGRTIRIRLATPGYIAWAPGQHFLLCIPSVSRFLSHPFTSASICDEQVVGDEGRMIVLLIRAKSGWTRDLWDTVIHLIASGRKHPRGEVPAGTTLPSSGVLLRSWVDGPFGSSVRTNWGDYSSILIVSGGSGVSFGLSILEYVCLCLAGRDGRFLGGTGTRRNFLTKRVRFVWLVREFSHIQWCATVLRRCMSVVPRDLCQIEIFVTNFQLPAKGPPLSPFTPYDPITPITPSATDRDELAPPKAGFMKDNRRKQNRASLDSDDGHDSDDSQADSYVDLSYYTGDFQGGEAEVPEGELGHEEHVLDLTNFDGDNDEHMPGEAQVNRTVRKEGKMRRALTRKGRKSKSRRNLEAYAGDSALKVPSWSEGPSSLKSRVSDSMKLVISRHGHGHKSSEMDLGMTSIKEAQELSPSTTIQPSPRDSKGSSISAALPDPDHRPSLSLAIESDARSVYSAASDMRDLLPQVGVGAGGDHVQLEVDDREMHDISVMAEFARPGRPKLDLILKDEVSKSTGSLVVACCGPTTLNAVMRKLVAAQIDPARIQRGDMSGSISFVAEDFAY